LANQDDLEYRLGIISEGLETYKNVASGVARQPGRRIWGPLARARGCLRLEVKRTFAARDYRATQAGNLRINYSRPHGLPFSDGNIVASRGAMKKLAAAIAAIALIGTPAFAQVPPPVPVYNWTGWYVGGNLGASFGSAKTDFNGPATVAFSSRPLGTGMANIAVAGFDQVYPSGFIGGGQIGFNWQFSPVWVVGLEADFQGADEKEHSNLTNNFSAPIFGGSVTGILTGTSVTDYQTKIEWFGTARVRAG
jgi:hypothetical protein